MSKKSVLLLTAFIVIFSAPTHITRADFIASEEDDLRMSQQDLAPLLRENEVFNSSKMDLFEPIKENSLPYHSFLLEPVSNSIVPGLTDTYTTTLLSDEITTSNFANLIHFSPPITGSFLEVLKATLGKLDYNQVSKLTTFSD